jgi:predicted enzyme related to lactoylglutathione lyase
MDKVTTFQIPTDDKAKSKAFYCGVLVGTLLPYKCK